MRTIKPGKLAKKAETKPKGQSLEKPGRHVWDDYSPPAKVKKKKEFSPDDTGRMQEAKLDRPEVAPTPVQENEGPAPEPRKDFETLTSSLGLKFSSEDLLERALTHRSAVGLSERADYERLEFLGDAVLDLSIADLLCKLYPDAREGELSKMRAALVNTQALAEIARSYEVGPFIRLGRGELSAGGADRPSILADVMEAIIGAFYQDNGFEDSITLIQKIFGDRLDQVTPYDPKTELQEALHIAGSEPPSYLLELVEGPEHAPNFISVVMVDNEVAGRGEGPTKKASQQAAAAVALEKLRSSAEDQSEVIVGGLLSGDEVLEPSKDE